MKCLCIQNNQIRINGKIHTVYKNAIMDLEELPTNGCWVSLEKDAENPHIVDFSKATVEELVESDTWKFDEAFEFMKTKYKVILKKGSKQQVAEAIVDAVYRSING